jgi:RNA methyltransferase, TrmH family
VAEGVRAVEELVKSKLVIRGVIVAPQLDDAPRGKLLRAVLEEKELDVASVNETEFRIAAETESPQGVLAIGETPSHSLTQLANKEFLRILVLDAVQDPGNVGTMLRTSAALGVDATVALPGTVDLWNAKVVRAAMGASFHHPAFHAAAAALFEFLDTAGAELWGAEAAGEPLVRGMAPARLALAVGNEGAGLSSSVRARARRLVSLPISGAVESLNVSVAAGILIYQLRQE